MSMTAFAQNLVTFSVDMNQYAGPAYSQVEVSGNFAGWCAGCIVMTETSPGSLIYTVDSVLIPTGPIEYKFTADLFAIQENLTPGTPCTTTNFGFTNRFADITESTDLGIVCWESCDGCSVAPSEFPVSFSVDMNEYTGPAYSQVEVSGNFAGWCGGCIVMSETSPGSLIYTVDNVMIPPGDIEYKFTADFFAIQENFFPGGSCTITSGGFTNRTTNITGPTDLGLVCWESCDPCETVAETVDITFEVNMSAVPTAALGVFLAGGGNFGNPGDNAMTETAPGSDIWTITVTRPVGFSSYYTFTNGLCPDYSCKENLADLPCGDPNNFNDRFLPSVNSNTTIQHCFGQCTTDGTCETVSFSDVTFSVDMNAYAGTFSSVSVGGTWNGFNPLDFPMTETSPGSGVYETTISLADGIYEYKFIEDGGAGPDEYFETLTEGDVCAVTNFGFTNRALTVAGNATLPTVCFEACSGCPVLGCQAPS
ncbi:MAG: hypothetical protein O2867_08565, partial [Bacteroidetes bacterium]|nr:hypothetical protein [Bacteroidota bacterium]